jgi:hypothetical protein
MTPEKGKRAEFGKQNPGLWYDSQNRAYKPILFPHSVKIQRPPTPKMSILTGSSFKSAKPAKQIYNFFQVQFPTATTSQLSPLRLFLGHGLAGNE